MSVLATTQNKWMKCVPIKLFLFLAETCDECMSTAIGCEPLDNWCCGLDEVSITVVEPFSFCGFSRIRKLERINNGDGCVCTHEQRRVIQFLSVEALFLIPRRLATYHSSESIFGAFPFYSLQQNENFAKNVVFLSFKKKLLPVIGNERKWMNPNSNQFF